MKAFNLPGQAVQLLALGLELFLKLLLQLLELALQGFDLTHFLTDGDIRPQPDDARGAG